ncbi:hypothetical protein [Flavobacterium hibisci]|uniref:hypothetical protein n=1 Tax=Flavobacterium hibisci TaxID=1914462 RepID=UPI001CC1362B|nr:hypothetical protein [Flavobacterium hibisci]MBZ4042646.1 hypothetical protein [Flavobacterium hibisci]
MTLNDNALNEYNISGDYEEFKFTPRQINLFGNNIDFEKNETSFFYNKKDKLVWCYEINILDNDDALKIIKSFETNTVQNLHFQKFLCPQKSILFF